MFNTLLLLLSNKYSKQPPRLLDSVSVSPVLDVPLSVFPPCFELICVSSWCSCSTCFSVFFIFPQDVFLMFSPPTVVGLCPWAWRGHLKNKKEINKKAAYSICWSISLPLRVSARPQICEIKNWPVFVSWSLPVCVSMEDDSSIFSLNSKAILHLDFALACTDIQMAAWLGYGPTKNCLGPSTATSLKTKITKLTPYFHWGLDYIMLSRWHGPTAPKWPDSIMQCIVLMLTDNTIN